MMIIFTVSGQWLANEAFSTAQRYATQIELTYILKCSINQYTLRSIYHQII